MALVLTEHKNHPSLHLPSRPWGANALLIVSGSSLGNKFWEGYFCGGTWLWNELRKNTCWIGRKWNWTERNVLWCSYSIDFCSEAETELKRSLNPNQQAGSLRSLRTSWWMWAAQRRAITLEKVALSGWGHSFCEPSARIARGKRKLFWRRKLAEDHSIHYNGPSQLL